jgi:RNAse (barnase) inhibitor barstar
MVEWVDIEKVYPPLRRGLPRLVPERSRLELQEALAAHGFEIYQLDGSRITDMSTFFQEAAQALQFPAYFGHNWDAFIECLGEFEDRPARRVAIVWRRADHTQRKNLGLLLEAVYWFLTVARDLGTYRADGAAPTQLELFLAGRGRQYATLSRSTYPTDSPDDE